MKQKSINDQKNQIKSYHLANVFSPKMSFHWNFDIINPENGLNGAEIGRIWIATLSGRTN